MKITSPKEMEKAAEALLRCVEEGSTRGGGALVLLLSGELGSGKTTFVQALARSLGIDERVTSPTFVIQKEYVTGEKGEQNQSASSLFKRLVHIDAYRLNNFAELEALSWGEYIQDSRTIVAVEWPEQVGVTAVLERAVSLNFSHVSENVRDLLFNGKETMC